MSDVPEKGIRSASDGGKTEKEKKKKKKVLFWDWAILLDKPVYLVSSIY